MADSVRPVTAISQAILKIQDSGEEDDLGDLVSRVDEMLSKILDQPKDASFSQAVPLYFSFMSACVAKKRITGDSYKELCLKKIEALSKSAEDNEDMQDYLGQRKVTIESFGK